MSGGHTTFKLPDERKLRIDACATEDDLAHPVEFDAEGQRCLIVGKDGNTTGLTVGRYASVVSFLENEVGVVSREFGICNAGFNLAEPFSKKGDSGSLVWHMRSGTARIRWCPSMSCSFGSPFTFVSVLRLLALVADDIRSG